MKFVDECDCVIDHLRIERSEQDLAEQFIEPHDIVIELGGRYGTVSCIINSKLQDPTNHVVVEPQFQVQSALQKNKQINNSQFHIINGFVSKKPLHLTEVGYGASFELGANSLYPCFDLADIQTKYNLQFNTLVADCEGGLESFFDDFPYMYTQLTKAIIEKDYPQKCNYDKIEQEFKNHGLQLIHTENGGFHQVWKKI